MTLTGGLAVWCDRAYVRIDIRFQAPRRVTCYEYDRTRDLPCRLDTGYERVNPGNNVLVLISEIFSMIQVSINRRGKYWYELLIQFQSWIGAFTAECWENPRPTVSTVAYDGQRLSIYCSVILLCSSRVSLTTYTIETISLLWDGITSTVFGAFSSKPPTTPYLHLFFARFLSYWISTCFVINP